MRFYAAALPFLASGVGAELVVLRSFQPAPSGARLAVRRTLEDAYNACYADVDTNGLCRPRDPFEDFFRGVGGPSSLRSFFDSDPFFRNDPFLRLAATPPSSSESPRILDQIFGDQYQWDPPPQMKTVQVTQGDDDTDDFTCLFKAIDGMMDSAMRMAMTPPPNMQRVSITFRSEEKGESTPTSPVDTAVSLLDSMVDGLLDHAASASASASNDVQEDREESDAPAVQADATEDAVREEAVREDILHDRSGRSRPSNDEGEAAHYEPEAPANVAEAEVRAPSPENPLHPTWDPVVLARKIAQHGRDILADEEEKNTKAGADGDLRRRLTEEDEAKSEVRKRMARRLTEVVPFGHLTVVPMMMPPPQRIQIISEAEADFPPRLGFGSQIDRCLWSLHREKEGASLSNGCSDALEGVEQSLGELKKEVTGNFQRATAVPEAPTGARGVAYRFAEFVQAQPSAFWGLWVALVIALLACACVSDDEEEDEYEEYGDASDYTLVQDADDDADEGRTPAGAVAFVGVPLPVV